MEIDSKTTIQIVKEAFDDFKDKEKYVFIGIIGSFVREDKLPSSADLDIVSICDYKVHREFKKHLARKFKEKAIDIFIFNTIRKKFLCPKEKFQIHDMYFHSFDDFLKKEWWTVINAVKNEALVLQGAEVLEEIPIKHVDRDHFYKGYLKWMNEIRDDVNYLTFEQHIKGKWHVFLKYGFEKEFDLILQIVNSQYLWQNKLKRIESVMKKENAK